MEGTKTYGPARILQSLTHAENIIVWVQAAVTKERKFRQATGTKQYLSSKPKVSRHLKNESHITPEALMKLRLHEAESVSR